MQIGHAARRVSIALAAGIGLFGLASPAAAQRQTFSGVFTSDRPGTPTGFHEQIDYIPQGSPEGKPYSVQTVKLTLAPGTRLDTSVPAQCKASDFDFQQRGDAACPVESRVGDGTVEVDTGGAVGGIPRIINFRAVLFNDQDTVILFLESTNATPQLRSAGRSPIEGTTITTHAPPVPGFPPPDPFTAVRSVRLTFDPVTRGSGSALRAYMTTPPTCPPAGSWINTASFTYRDGVNETAESTSACAADEVAPPTGAQRPVVALRGVPGIPCVSRTFTARVSVTAPAGIRRVRLLLDGRQLKQTRATRFSTRIRTRRLRPGRHKLRVVATDRAGRRARKVRTFRVCPRRPSFVG